MEKIHTVFPSTTTSAMISLETGLTPAEHGIVGWTTYSREIGGVVTPYRDALEASMEFRLSKAGFASIFPNPRLLINASANSRLLVLYDEQVSDNAGKRIENCDQEFYATQVDMMLRLRDIVKRGQNGFVYAYYPWIDHIEHIYGPCSEAAKESVVLFFMELNRILIPTLKESGYRLVITADHGQTTVEKDVIIDAKSEVLRYLSGPPWGDARILYLNAISGKEEKLRSSFEKLYGNDAMLFDSDSLISTGIFGKKEIPDDLRYRFGTHIMLAKGNVKLMYEYPKETPIKHHVHFGMHSGLSKDEIEIPLIIY